MKMIATPEQMIGARGLLRWSQARLAKEAGVARSTIALIERGDDAAHNASRERAQRALEAAGISFFPADSVEGEGVRFALPLKKRGYSTESGQ